MNKWTVLSVWCTQLSSTEFKCSSAFLKSEDWKLTSLKGLLYYSYRKHGQIFVLVCPIKKDWLLEFVDIPFLPSVLFFCHRKLSSMIKFKEVGVISDVSFSNRKTSFYIKKDNMCGWISQNLLMNRNGNDEELCQSVNGFWQTVITLTDGCTSWECLHPGYISKLF